MFTHLIVYWFDSESINFVLFSFFHKPDRWITFDEKNNFWYSGRRIFHAFTRVLLLRIYERFLANMICASPSDIIPLLGSLQEQNRSNCYPGINNMIDD